MIENVILKTTPRVAADNSLLVSELARSLRVSPDDINDFRITRRSVDARQRNVVVTLAVAVATGDDPQVEPPFVPVEFRHVPHDAPQVVIVGAGPAGLFAALRAIELGVRPILVERGKDVDRRRRDLARLSRSGEVDPESNYCFGEGGAGAYSDGKLFTRSKKRGHVEDILNLLCQHGASTDILVDAHPHIGSDRLPDVIRNIRRTIVENGGEVRFERKATDLIIEEGRVKGICTVAPDDEKDMIDGPVILATGHSARDVYRSLDSQGVRLEPKGFAMGVRLEHPQKLIDRLRYHSADGRGKWLPAADYSFVTQVDGRGVYSFCMCPGGVIVPASSAPGEQVVNGMSASARASQWANSGMVVEIRPGDVDPDGGVFELLDFQERTERKFFEAAGNSINAPAQRMTDFVAGRDSSSLPRSSYAPGIHPARLDKLLPSFVAARLQRGFRDFDRRNRGFLTSDAILVGLESRTSSPVRIPRDRETLSHIDLQGLFPAGEGAGYAGGIVSAAVDGRRCAESCCQWLKVSTGSPQ